MRWTAYHTRLQRKIQKKTEWNKWFAWYPVRVYDETVWLEFVERRGRRDTLFGTWWYSYRELNRDSNV